MNSKTAGLSSWTDIYRKAFESCLALWPIFLLRVCFLFLNLMLLVLGFMICCWPLFQQILGNWNNLNNGNVQSLIREINWVGYFSDFKMLLLIGCFVAFYITFICFFLAFFDAAVYTHLNQNQKNGTPFCWKLFFEGGVKKMVPMAGLQVSWILVLLGFFLGMVFLLALVGVWLAKLFSWWALLLAVPAGLVLLLAVILLMSASILSYAYLVDGHGIWDSIQSGFSKAFEHEGRATWALCLLMLIYFVFLTAFTIVFGVLALIPHVGIFFMIFKFLVTSFLAIGFQIYMASLSVSFALEKKKVH